MQEAGGRESFTRGVKTAQERPFGGGSDMDPKVSTQLSEVQRKVQSDPVARQSERENSIRGMAGSQK